MFERRKDIFDIRVRGPHGAIRESWTEVVHCIPYALHGDAVPVLKGKKQLCGQWFFLLGGGTSIDVNMLMACYWSRVKKQKP